MRQPLATLPTAVLAPGGSTPDANATDEQLIDLWLHERSDHTKDAYRRDVRRMLTFIGKPLRLVTLRDLQDFADSLKRGYAPLKPSSRARVLAACKSLLTFAQKIGALAFNVGAALKKPAVPDALHKRILTEADVQRMLALTTGRDHVLVRLLYNAGFRVSELCSITWADLTTASDGALLVTVTGKGNKTREVRLSLTTSAMILDLRGDAPLSGFVFTGRTITKGLSPVQAWRIVRDAARLAGIEKAVSPHWMRHAHASHALDHGAKITAVRDTLGHSSFSTTNRYAHAKKGESSGDALAV